ncbi:LysR family transcriptional regulator substrate-binding protein, partial [Acidisphaera sp. S103]|uniref:LysR family transcriptional regulator substrate-binding protein n=1 Tax=Acidisphaera sp. S103 TaxID=1747223 RepID=UPI0015758B60
RALLPEQVARFPKGSTARQLAQCPFIAYRAGGYTRTITEAWFDASAVLITPIMELVSFEAIKVLVGAGLGADSPHADARNRSPQSEPSSFRNRGLRRR